MNLVDLFVQSMKIVLAMTVVSALAGIVLGFVLIHFTQD
jgi:hypothetical protein